MVLTLDQYKNYANFNTVTFQGRVANAKLCMGPKGEFLAVTIISNLTEDKSIYIDFKNNNGMITLFNNGNLPNGRIVTVVGRINSVSETYFDKKTGQTLMLKSPKIDLGFDATIPGGGLGPIPASAKAQRAVGGTVVNNAPVDEAPSYEEELLNDQPDADAVASGDVETPELLAKPLF